ncbi:alpha-amylase family glycosyl hydrolase [uncultured Xanthomonas sp.]|uniref:alpha-amylase family glycosyl hydrolase n=1 Tax=uncultured Xanthomonas sp. TaxID=152831 RepID=UPI0025D9A5B9|nr:alpha-amylase family glycosyl hydrolase [uncultured Xanthomonas sp.]
MTAPAPSALSALAHTLWQAHLQPDAADAVLPRLQRHGERLLAPLHALYGAHPAFAQWLPQWLTQLAATANARPSALRQLDAERAPDWFATPAMLGYSAYVDRFAGTLHGVGERVPYLQELGVRYLHLLPFLRARAGDNDGGFAVSDYGQVEPRLGDTADLAALTARLRAAGISLCADFVLNHTADDHPWALAAKRGDARHLDYYHHFRDRSAPDAYERTLGQVFPHTAPGNFTWVQDADAWLWTTFYPYQWDLDWSNPAVFGEMALALLHLANLGVEVFRLDSTAYLWKRPGTDCMNQTEAHTILQALRALTDILAPAVLLKAEAIVPMAQLPPYFGEGASRGHECHLAYHSTLMAAGWVALAEQRGDIVQAAIAHTPALPPACGWLSYVRCHDDIGWNVLQREAAGGDGVAPFALARIAQFYAGDTADSYARGEAFQSSGEGVHGSNGMSAALTGITAALATDDADALELGVRRLLLLYAVALAMPGIPLLYMGDELALGNDEAYRDDPLRQHEGRWLHRPAMDWARAAQRHDTDSLPGQVYTRLRGLIAARAATAALAADQPLRAVPLGDPALLGLARGEAFVAMYNFSAEPVAVDVAATLGDGNWQAIADGGSDPAALAHWNGALPAYSLRWWLRG